LIEINPSQTGAAQTRAMLPETQQDRAAHAPAGDESDHVIQILMGEHTSLRAVLQSLLMMVERGPGDEPERFFDVLRAMLFYIDEFPERLHHPKESNLLFPRVVRVAPELMDSISKLEHDHMRGEELIRSLQHTLLAWEMLGDSRQEPFAEAAHAYVAFYLEHMRLEETVVLPAAKALLSTLDWKSLATAFAPSHDLFAGPRPPDAIYDRLFTKIVTNAPAPIGVGKP
jgi:hemerythrin-like domain-containing protein